MPWNRAHWTTAAASPRCNDKSILRPPHTPQKVAYSRKPADRRKRVRPASPYRRPRRCRCRPSERARSPAAGSASGCRPQAAEGPPSSLRARPPPALPAAPRFPLTRTSGAASQHGASARNSACTRDKQRLQSRAAQPLPFRPSGDRGPAGLELSLAPRRRVPAAALPPPRPPANCRTGSARPRALGVGRIPQGGGPALCWAPRPGPTSSPAPASCFPAPAGRSRSRAATAVASRSTARPLAGGWGAYRRRRRRTTFPTRGCVTGRRVPGQRGSGAQRPARARGPRGQSAALRPARDTTLSRPGRRAPSPGASLRAGLCSPPAGVRDAPGAFVGGRASAKPPPALSGKLGEWRVAGEGWARGRRERGPRPVQRRYVEGTGPGVSWQWGARKGGGKCQVN